MFFEVTGSKVIRSTRVALAALATATLLAACQNEPRKEVRIPPAEDAGKKLDIIAATHAVAHDTTPTTLVDPTTSPAK